MSNLLESEEKRSYSALFLITIAMLFACLVWALWQDVFSRHLWKKYKTDFYRTAIEKYEGEIAAEDERLAGIEEYVALQDELVEVQSALAGSGEEGRRLRALEDELAALELVVTEKDLALRIVKGEIEEGWYMLEHAQHGGESGEHEHEVLDALMEDKVHIEEVYNTALAERDAVAAKIDEVRSREAEIRELMVPFEEAKAAAALKLDGVSMEVPLLGHRVAKVPVVEQVVLADFERNNFENWVLRTERCQNCHVAIDKAGFEEEENPLKTHPDRKYYLGNHEVRLFGCTPCHGGQGAAINSVEQAHGNVTFWEDPLLSTADKIQGKCLGCHLSSQGIKGAGSVATGEALFRDLGCHGCHLIEGFGDLPEAGPSLKRLAAKVRPEWLVEWVEDPKAFRPRTRMPHFFLTRDESVAVSAYILAASISDSESWLESHGAPSDVDANSASMVDHGRNLSESLGCLGCHGFEAEQFASQVAVGMDTAPNLARIAEKTNERWLYNWILNPREYSEMARMPRLRLDDKEAAAITSYLLTLREEKPLPVDAELRAKLADAEVIEEGAKLIRKYGCFGCHVIPGMENESRVSVELSAFGGKHLEELFFGDRLDIPNTWDDWTINKLLTPRTYQTERIEQAMPEFGFDHDDARALTVFLAAQSDRVINAKYKPEHGGMATALKEGRELITFYNCQGCHSFDGKDGAIRKYYEGDDAENAPPTLVKEGIKLQPDWFFDFLKKPMRLRPWLDVRMPSFDMTDEETAKVVRYFAALDGYDVGSVVLEARDEANTAAAAGVADPNAPAECSACHAAGSGDLEGTVYSVSRMKLSAADRAAWIAEHVEGAESDAEGEESGDLAGDLAEYLGRAN